MAKRVDDHWRLEPNPRNTHGCRWETIEPMLRRYEKEPRQSETFLSCWSAVKGIRTVHDQHGEWLVWTVYGKALTGPYELQRMARRGTCEKCGHDAAGLWGGSRLVDRFCRNCLLDHKRALDRLAAKRRRRRSGEVSTPSVMPCTHCGATFTPKRSTAQFCSTACRVAAHRASKAPTAPTPAAPAAPGQGAP